MCRSKALKILLFDKDIAVNQAMKLGIADNVAPQKELEKAAMDTARRICSKTRPVIGGSQETDQLFFDRSKRAPGNGIQGIDKGHRCRLKIIRSSTHSLAQAIYWPDVFWVDVFQLLFFFSENG
jgi:enoyl-CoA hydratase/carnithine racemase